MVTMSLVISMHTYIYIYQYDSLLANLLVFMVFGRAAGNGLSGSSKLTLLNYFSTTFHKHCGRCESLGTTTTLAMARGNQGHAPCKIFMLQQILFQCQFMFLNIIRLFQH